MNIEQLNKANKEISELKAQLKTNEDVNNSLLDLSAARAKKVNNENDELRAQFAAVKYLIDGAYCENSENNAGLEREWLNKLYRMIDTDNDNQCLIDINVSAIRDAISNSEQVELAGQGYVGTYVSLEGLEVNILQLGETGK